MRTSLRRLSGILIAVLTLVCLFCLFRLSGKDGSEFCQNIGENRFSMSFYPLNCAQSVSFHLEKGDKIETSLVRAAGRLAVFIGQEGKTPVYQGNDMELSSFQVEIPEEGDYLLTVKGKRAEGSISFEIIR